MISCISLPFQLSIIFFNKYYVQSALLHQKENQLASFTSRQKAKEIEILKQQIDPHFIFNSFNTLSFLIGEDSSRAKAFSATGSRKESERSGAGAPIASILEKLRSAQADLAALKAEGKI